MLSYSGCIPDSAADKSICKVHQQECWINFPKIILKIFFFNVHSSFFFSKWKYRTSQRKRKLQDLALSYLFLVKYLEITDRFCYRQAPNPGIFRCKSWQCGKAHLGSLADFLGYSWHQGQTHLSLSMCPAFKGRQVSTLKEKPIPHLPESVEEALTAQTENLSFLLSSSAPARRDRERCDTTNKINTAAGCGTANLSFPKEERLHCFCILQVSHPNVLLTEVNL